MQKHFTRTCMANIDGKNRIGLPAEFREVLGNRSGQRDKIILDKHLELPCLVGFDAACADQQYQSVMDQHGLARSSARDEMLSDLFADQVHCNLDSGGRFVYDWTLKVMMPVGSDVMFRGLGDHFQIWNPDIFINGHDKRGIATSLVHEWRGRKGAAA